METVRTESPLPLDAAALPCGICSLCADGPAAIVRANEAFYAIFGYTPGEAAEAGFTSLAAAVAADDWPMARTALTDGLRAGGPFQFALRAVHRSGRPVWALLRLRPEDDGLLACAALDVTAEKAPTAEDGDGGLLHSNFTLGRQLERACYRTIMELSGLILMESDADTGTYYASPTVERFAFSERLGQKGNNYMLTPELVHPEDWVLAEALSQTIRTGTASARASLRLLRRDGSYQRCQLAINVLRNVDGTIARSLVTALPIDTFS